MAGLGKKTFRLLTLWSVVFFALTCFFLCVVFRSSRSVNTVVKKRKCFFIICSLILVSFLCKKMRWVFFFPRRSKKKMQSGTDNSLPVGVSAHSRRAPKGEHNASTSSSSSNGQVSKCEDYLWWCDSKVLECI